MSGEDATAATPPPGVMPMLITMKPMEAMGLKTGDGIKDTVPWKLFNTEEAKAEIVAKGFYSAFHPFREYLAKYDLENILVIADDEEIYGENWMICVTAEAFEAEMEKFAAADRAKEEAERAAREAEEAARLEKERLDNMVYHDEPLDCRPYSSSTAAATSADVQLLTTRRRRPLLALQIVRKRREFGAPAQFRDKEGGEQNGADFRQQRNPNYELTRQELSIGLQACAGLMSGHSAVGTQTTWHRSVHNSMQTEPLDMPADAHEKVATDPVQDFLEAASSRCEHALQQNETLNIFQDELALLDDDDMLVVGSKGENVIREARTFMDLEFSGNTSLVDIDWHPKSRQWLAAATAMNWTFEERVERSGRTTKSHILVYNFSEFSSQIVLEAPQEVLTFRWNPTNPALIAAGCITGQVLLFDLSAAQDVLNRKSKRKGESGESDKAFRVKPCAVSTIDLSHRRQVTQLEWLPPTVELVGKSRARDVPDGTVSYQFITTAGDGQLLVWDTRYKEKAAKKIVAVKAKDKGPVEIPWLPTYRCNLMKGAMELGLCRFDFKANDAFAPMYCGTEEGEVVYADWAPERREAAAAAAGAGAAGAGAEAEDDGPPQRVMWTSNAHHQRPLSSLQRSPFFNDLVMSVGDWCFSLWREGMQTPLFTSPNASTNLCSGRWSPTRPAVVFISKSDGTIDIWDLLDQTHKPSLTTSIVSTPITSMQFRPTAGRSMKQLLAVGDANGNLHVMEIPQQLRRGTANEDSLMSAYLKREEERVAYAEDRAVVRAEEKVQADIVAAAEEAKAERLAAAEQDGVDLAKVAAEAERQRMAAEEKAYAELEKKFIQELGITEEYLREARSAKAAGAGAGFGDTADLDGVQLSFSLTATQ